MVQSEDKMVKNKDSKIKIGISVGDLNGIGYEVVLKTLEDIRIAELFTPIIFGSKKAANYYMKLLQLNNLNLNLINNIEEAKGGKINLILVCSEDNLANPGEESKAAGQHAFESLKAATDALKENLIDGLVTAPINKNAIQSSDFEFPGHTEFLQSIDGAKDSLMLMLSDSARIGVVTGHIPLKDVGFALTDEAILRKITIFNKTLKQDFNIRKPKIAVMGLNPHAGDNGLLGKEENEIIIPAINQAKSIGIMAVGPFAADGFFGSSNYKNFDGILAMYHDQGLIPAKSFSFGGGVNFTAGLSFVRTSPDHGTAFDIAGKGEANESSFRQALYTAIAVIKNRNMNEELIENALVVNKTRN